VIETDLRTAVIEAIARVAPEAYLALVRPDADLRDELDLDSMDFMSYVIQLHQKLGVDIPVEDYAKFSTLQGALDYLRSRLLR
jgi:acyl carrier protein